MTSVISMILLILNSAYALTRKHSKYLAFLLMFFAWILFWGNTQNPDYSIYSTMYYSNAEFTTDSLEKGYIYLIKLGNLIGMRYEVFVLILSLIGYVLIHSTIKAYSNNFNYVYFLYFIVPYFLDIVQIRNFLVTSIFIYSTKYLINNSRFKYCALIILAASIHSIALAYLPIVLVTVKRKQIIISISTFFSILASILILLNDKQIAFLNDITIGLNIDKLSNYLSTTTNYGYLLFWGLQIMSFSVIHISKKIYTHKNRREFYTDINFKFIDVVYWINIMSFIYFPLYILNSNFTRLIRNVILLNYVVFALVNEDMVNQKEKVIYTVIIVLYVIIMFVALLWVYKDTIIKTVLQNNLIF